ncbi:MAG: hypothetical protein ACOCZQ_01595, partial [Nanoarchaeota archaeon]
PKDKNKDFSLEHYREILRKIKKSHKTLSFKDANKMGKKILDIEKFVIMRHDVEFSLRSAKRLAEIENEEDITSTFFILQTGDYNPFEEYNANIIKKILELGHDIGLHYDAALFERFNLEPEQIARQQLEMFETFFNTKIYAMSSHMPMRSGKTFALPGITDVYDPLYLNEIKYLSDSTQSWREGVVTENLPKYPKIHLLMHEYLWHPKAYGWDTLLLLDAHEKYEKLWNEALKNIDKFRQGLKLREKKDREFKERYGIK